MRIILTTAEKAEIEEALSWSESAIFPSEVALRLLPGLKSYGSFYDGAWLEAILAHAEVEEAAKETVTMQVVDGVGNVLQESEAPRRPSPVVTRYPIDALPVMHRMQNGIEFWLRSDAPIPHAEAIEVVETGSTISMRYVLPPVGHTVQRIGIPLDYDTPGPASIIVLPSLTIS